MKLEKIEWKFPAIPPKLNCCICKKPAGHLAIIGNFRVPVCLECGKLEQGELLRRAVGIVVKTEGKTDETL
jgi:hypothetical protein